MSILFILSALLILINEAATKKTTEHYIPTIIDDIADVPPQFRTMYQLMNDKLRHVDSILARAAVSKHMFQVNIAFEVGFLVAEIQDRYKRMLNIYNDVLRNYITSMYTSEAIIYFKDIEHLHIEISHLANMNHELKKKYDDIENDPAALDAMSRFNSQKMARLKKQKKKLEKRKKKQEKKEKKFFALTVNRTTPKKNRYYFPLTYGWEIEYW